MEYVIKVEAYITTKKV